MAADRYRTQTLVIVALAALFICAGSITAGVFVYDRLQARANPTPAAGVQALSAQGLLVTAVVPGSPADGALQRGDILLQAADRPLRTPRDLQLELTALPPDSPLALTLLRGDPVTQFGSLRLDTLLDAGVVLIALTLLQYGQEQEF